MDEFGLIACYFAPLASGFSGSLNLSDDAALVDVPTGHQLVVTKDAISAGVHFLGSEHPSLIARKLLRVNLSDLAAMGARPLTYFLAIMLTDQIDAAWLEQFAQGLAQDQQEFGIALGGGDTIATSGNLSFSITALGLVETGTALRRSGARPGDRIYVSGTLGDSALGLDILQGRIKTSGDFLQQRYFLPEPRLALGQKLIGIASATIDISDGLMQDLGHICAASKAGAVLKRSLLPLSPEARTFIAEDPVRWDRIIAGGDDYELLFTVPVEKEAEIKALGLPLTYIGDITQGDEVQLLDEMGKRVVVESTGFKHF